MKQHQSFASLIRKFEHHYDLRTVFDDFLVMSVCSLGRNPETGLSYDEALYIETIARYKDTQLRFVFPELFACLTEEMTKRFDSSEGYDVLGEFFEEHLSRKGSGQFFTPWHVCMLMAKITKDQAGEAIQEKTEPLRILDPSCGSGRMLLASARCNGPSWEYYGIDLDPLCARMTIVNLFLSGLFRAEVMCANALLPDDFRVSYRSSLVPLGIFRIQEKEKSRLWQMQKATWERNRNDDGQGKNPGGPQMSISEQPGRLLFLLVFICMFMN